MDRTRKVPSVQSGPESVPRWSLRIHPTRSSDAFRRESEMQCTGLYTVCLFIAMTHRHEPWFKVLSHHHQTPEKETLQYTPQLVKTVVKEIMKVESSKQSRSMACCSMTIDSKSHLVAPAVSTEYPVIQKDALRRLSQRAFDVAGEEE